MNEPAPNPSPAPNRKALMRWKKVDVFVFTGTAFGGTEGATGATGAVTALGGEAAPSVVRLFAVVENLENLPLHLTE
jgi:hypothetical protein